MSDTVTLIRSSNKKLGHIPTTMRPQTTCPSECPLLGAGCYGENKNGRPSIFDLVDRSPKRITLEDVRKHTYRKDPPRAIRFNVVGDFFDAEGRPDMAYIAETNATAASRPWTAWSYTHGWRRLKPEWFTYVVRASCETPEEVAEARALGWEAVIVVDNAHSPVIGTTIANRKVVECPVTAGRAATCEDCRLCGRNAAVVAFPAHGTKKTTVKRMLAAKEGLA